MGRNLFNSIAQRLVVDYCRLSIVGNKDGFLTKDDVCSLLSKAAGAVVVVGSNLMLRIHYEQVYKHSTEGHYIYVCENTKTLLADMRRDAYIVDFAITDMFPLFADKALLRNQPVVVLSRIYEEMGIRRISIPECHELVGRIHNEIEIRRKESAEHYLSGLQDVDVDWIHPNNTISHISKIIVKAIRNGVYDSIDSEISKQNSAFQSWVDSDYFAFLHSNYLLHPKSVNNILPYLAEKHGRTDKIALLIVDGFTYWQGVVLTEYLSNNGMTLKLDSTLAWIPTITMLSRQAIFRGTDPKLEYKQSPDNERKLWFDYWTKKGYGQYEVQYICDKDEFAINESTMRLAVVTVEMDEKMHASTDYQDLLSLTENWCPRITEKIKAMKSAGFAVYITTDHGSVLSHGWRPLTRVEKVFLYKDGSRGARHLIYKDIDEQQRFFNDNNQLPMLRHDNWLAIKNDRCFANEYKDMITHGGSHFLEVVIPFIII